MKGRWYTFVWIATLSHNFYLIVAHNDAEDAIIEIFKQGGYSPNEHNKEFEKMRKTCDEMPIISMNMEGKLFPYWFIVNESQLDAMIEGLTERNIEMIEGIKHEKSN